MKRKAGRREQTRVGKEVAAGDSRDSTFSEDRALSPRVLRQRRESLELVKAKNRRGIFPLPQSTSDAGSKPPLNFPFSALFTRVYME